MNPLLVSRPAASTLYDSVSEDSAAMVIRRYSSSFGLASLLLAKPVRTQVRNVYALVRVADEIVDNPDPALGSAPRERMLTSLQEDVRQSLETGYSGNLVVHAFARTAIACGIDEGIIDPFFASMRMDLHPMVHTPESFDRYVYGSAEVVGLMCLRAFLADGPDRDRDYDRLAPGAQRLGAAFQKLNFLRDLAEDHDLLRRSYFPGLEVEEFDDEQRDQILLDIADDLDAAAAVITELPTSSRRAVLAAHATFSELAIRLAGTPAADILRTRVRVPDPTKVRVVAGALYAGRR